MRVTRRYLADERRYLLTLEAGGRSWSARFTAAELRGEGRVRLARKRFTSAGAPPEVVAELGPP